MKIAVAVFCISTMVVVISAILSKEERPTTIVDVALDILGFVFGTLMVAAAIAIVVILAFQSP